MDTGIFKTAAAYEERELSSAEEDAFRFAAACYKAEKAAARLIARAEQNSFGLAAKLERRGHDTRAVKAVISVLSDRNLLDDARYAERWILSRLAAVTADSSARSHSSTDLASDSR